MSPQSRTALLVALATFALALALRLTGIGGREPWLDEVYSQFAISREWYGLVADRIGRGHSPLYYALMKAFGIEGEDIFAMRAASAAFDAGGAAILAGALTKYVNLRAGLFFGILYAGSPLAIDWAQNARPYGLLMLFTGIAVTGAMGLMATLGRGADAPGVRRSMRLFGYGFSLASLTMTAGIFAFAVTALLPFALPRFRADRAFMARWKRAVKVPAIVAFLGYWAFSGPHIARQVEGYWADKYNTLGIEGLSRLWQQVMIGDVVSVTFAQTGLSQGVLSWLIWTVSLALFAFALRGALASRARPALLAPLLLTVGYVLLLIAVSSWTSVLVSRYFLPAWICFLALAASGMATFSTRWPWGWTVILPVLGIMIASGFNQASMPDTPPRDRSLRPVAEIIARVPPEKLRLLYDKLNDNRTTLILELYPMRYSRPELGRPDMNSFTRQRLEDALEQNRDVFSYMTDTGLADALASGVAEPACQHDFGDWVLAYWGTNPAACAP